MSYEMVDILHFLLIKCFRSLFVWSPINLFSFFVLADMIELGNYTLGKGWAVDLSAEAFTFENFKVLLN